MLLLSSSLSHVAVLLCLLPYAVTAFLYWVHSAELFASTDEAVTWNWTARLFLPLLAGTLTPLVLAVQPTGVSSTGRLLLVIASVAGVIFTVVVGRLFLSPRWFYDMQLGIRHEGYRSKRFTRRRVVVGIGLGIIIYGGVVSVVVSWH
jgi:hypothetical protein